MHLTDVVWPEDAVEVGRVAGAWGVKGAIKVTPFASDPQALFSSRRWFLKPPDALPGAAASARTVKLPPLVRGVATGPSALPAMLKVTQVREQGDVIVATAQEIPDRDIAEALQGARVFVSRASFPTAGDDEYYWVDLIGLDVVNREGVPMGRVVGLIETGPHCVLRVCPPGQVPGAAPDPDERLIPFVANYVDDVSIARRLITVDWSVDY